MIDNPLVKGGHREADLVAHFDKRDGFGRHQALHGFGRHPQLLRRFKQGQQWGGHANTCRSIVSALPEPHECWR
ncbi:MAG: hypothetical protein ACOYMW_13140 [Candidatus Competibacteraceae bacterium]